MEAHQKAILKAIDKIPAFVINEGDIEFIRLSVITLVKTIPDKA